MINITPLPISIHKNGKTVSLYRIVEFGYIAYIWYSMFGVKVGIALPYLGTIWLIALTLLCIPLFKWKGRQTIHLLFAALISGSHILIQLLLFDGALTMPYIYGYFWWPFFVIILSTLIQRRGFFEKLIINMVTIAFIWSPFVFFVEEAGVQRAALDAGNTLDNPNGYAIWMGFCAIVMWLWSLKKISHRKIFLLRLAGILALLLAIRTISRGLIVLIAVAFILSLWKIKIHRSAMILFISVGLVIFFMTQVPYTQKIFESYAIRFNEQPTSRTDVVLVAIQAITLNPISGYGVPHLRNVLPITPHNEIILLWITSGIVPALLYIVFVIYILRLGLRYKYDDQLINPLPILVFVIMIIPLGNVILPQAWAVSAVCYVFAFGEWAKEKRKSRPPNLPTRYLA